MLNKKVKVLILHNYMAPYRFSLFKEIYHNPKVDVTVYFMSSSAKNRRWKIPTKKLGFKYEVLPKIEFSYFCRDLFTYIINYTFPIKFLKVNFDIIISAGWLDFASQAAFILSKLTGKKFVIWSESTINERSWRRAITLPFVRFIVRHSDAYIAIGSLSKEYLISLGAKPEKVFVAYSTVDVPNFEKKSKITNKEKIKIRQKIGIKTSKVILYVGQFIERKGIRYLIDAFKILKKEFDDVSLVLLGYGPLEEIIRSYVKDKVVRDVFFLGHVEVDKMPMMYAMADIFVLPSLEETWGLVINEAMACGLPVITTDKVGSSVDLIAPGKNGYIVEAGNSKELSLVITKLIKSKYLLNDCSKYSRKIINNITPKMSALSFTQAINSITN